MNYRVTVLLLLLLRAQLFYAQTSPPDTVSMSFADAQQLFIKNNFLLLAQRYNTDIARAAKKQAKLWSNPVFFAEINAYNPHTKTWFNTGSYTDPATGATNYGTYDLQLNQLVQTACKRNKLIALAETNVKLQEAAFEELMRQMRLDLFNAYTNLSFNQQIVELLQKEQKRISDLVDVEKIAMSKGAVSGYEVTRLQYELQDLQAQINAYKDAVSDGQAALNLFFCNKSYVYYKAGALPLMADKELNVAQLRDSALQNRPDIKTARYSLDQNNLNLKLQRATNAPDLIFGAHYDRNGGAYLNYSGVNVSMPLPVFNQNKGNIQSAKIQVLQAQTNQQYVEVSIGQDVYNSYEKYKHVLDLQNQLQDGYEESLKHISREATENYNKRTIGLLDYIDKSRTYRNAKINLMQLETNLLQSKQYINYTCNSNIF